MSRAWHRTVVSEAGVECHITENDLWAHDRVTHFRLPAPLASPPAIARLSPSGRFLAAIVESELLLLTIGAGHLFADSLGRAFVDAQFVPEETVLAALTDDGALRFFRLLPVGPLSSYRVPSPGAAAFSIIVGAREIVITFSDGDRVSYRLPDLAELSRGEASLLAQLPPPPAARPRPPAAPPRRDARGWPAQINPSAVAQVAECRDRLRELERRQDAVAAKGDALAQRIERINARRAEVRARTERARERQRELSERLSRMIAERDAETARPALEAAKAALRDAPREEGGQTLLLTEEFRYAFAVRNFPTRIAAIERAAFGEDDGSSA
jgi:hypothetical protein